MTKHDVSKHPGGRPQMYTPEQIQEIVDDLRKYIENNDDPTIVGFTSSYNKYSVNKDYISDHAEFSECRKKSIEKQEAYLLDGVTKGKLNAPMGIFRLKQRWHGYRDKTEQEITNPDGSLNPYNSLTAQELRKLAGK